MRLYRLSGVGQERSEGPVILSIEAGRPRLRRLRPICLLVSEVPLSQQIKGLHEDLYDVGFSQSADVGDSTDGKTH